MQLDSFPIGAAGHANNEDNAAQVPLALCRATASQPGKLSLLPRSLNKGKQVFWKIPV